MKRFIASLLFLLTLCAMSISAGRKPKPVYIPMDYSFCGYHASERAIPNVANKVVVNAQVGDCSELIQRAINYVSNLKADKNGFRGAVLLDEGTFHISKALRVNASGVVIRGASRDKTIIIKEGVDRGALVYFEGKDDVRTGDTLNITDTKVLAGKTSFSVSNARKLKMGDRVMVTRPSTWEWIDMLGCRDFGGGLDYTGWKPTDIDITWSRTVTAINGNEITLNVPITSTLSKEYGGGKVIIGYNHGEIKECGIENVTLMSAHNDWNAKDEDHCWDAVFMDNTSDCWVRRVNFRHFAGSAVNIQKQCRRTTVEDCVAEEPVSEIGGWRRGVFITRGEQTLIQRCVSRHGVHDFAAGFCAAGPNAFVQCEGEESLGFSGSIGSWATGLLFDIVNIDGNDIRFANLEQFQFGTGWNTANSMLWQCTASTIESYSPDADDRNSANGCWGTLTGNGYWTGSNDHVNPRSLYYDQLQKRLGEKAINGYILPRGAEDASSSPTLEEAARLAKLSLNVPRLTMQMWIDSVPFTASVSAKGLKNATKLKAAQEPKAEKHEYAIVNGKLTFDGKLIVGNKYNIPWWSGRVKDNFVKNQAYPAITRFVPGREGTGWTDRIDSVVNYLNRGKYCILDQHYGLWYDLRRTDHERIRRSDGDVWAPFYDQAFSRSGVGTSWDGLSKYDLTKPNQWYWQRLRDYADKGAQYGQLLFSENYFQHNILEAGAHWVDCPWRAVNNINGTTFPEPVPYAGDKRIFMAEQFYDINNPVLRPLHKQYINQCLDNLKGNSNAIQLISDEYTGPLHFTKFWLSTVKEWENKNGKKNFIALACTKDAQDSILSDAIYNKVVDIIDIRYWHYNTKGIWAPPAGHNMAPRQFMRKMKVGKTGFEEAYKAVREYRDAYKDKVVTFFAQQYPDYGWAILLAGGSCPNIPVGNEKFLKDVVYMNAFGSFDDYKIMGNESKGYIVYTLGAKNISLKIADGRYRVSEINAKTGEIREISKNTIVNGSYSMSSTKEGQIFWIEKL